MKLIITLKGGFGNQLFQLSAGLRYISLGCDVAFDVSSLDGSKKHNLPLVKEFIEKHGSKQFPAIEWISSPPIFAIPVSVRILEIILSFKINLPNNLTLLINDYFQKPEFHQFNLMRDFFGCDSINVDGSQHALCHVRRGDYLSSKNSKIYVFVDVNYYIEGLNKISAHEADVFSDANPSDLVEFAASSDKIFHVREVEDDVLIAFDMMRRYGSYILGNSTFGWWAAALSYASNPVVVLPSPWFKSGKGFWHPYEIEESKE